jgi:hypothetical protein
MAGKRMLISEMVTQKYNKQKVVKVCNMAPGIVYGHKFLPLAFEGCGHYDQTNPQGHPQRLKEH